MLISALRTAISSGNFTPVISAILASVFLVFVVIPIHEFAHAWVAVKMGDQTPRLAGGLTLNPMAHIDPVGAIMIALIGFGWGKPTPINPNNFRNRKLGVALTSAAGPLSNILFGWLLLFLSVVVSNISAISGTNLEAILYYFFLYGADISIYLAVLNLLPIPPFDGYGVIEEFLPRKAYYWVKSHQNIISIVIIVLLFTGILTWPLEYLSNYILRFFYWLSALPFT